MIIFKASETGKSQENMFTQNTSFTDRTLKRKEAFQQTAVTAMLYNVDWRLQMCTLISKSSRLSGYEHVVK